MSSRYQTCQLTASQKARLDGEVVFHWPHWCLCAAKWIFTIVLGLLVLCGAVVSRMSLIAVPYSKSDPFNVTKEFKFLTLVLIIMVPYAVEFLRCLWLHGFVRGHLWPSRIAIGLVSKRVVLCYCLNPYV